MSRLTKYCEYCVDSECIWYDKELAKDNKCECNKSRDNCHDRSIYNKLREYEDLEEQGLLLKLPCKVGSTVWWLNGKFIMESEVVGFLIDEDGVSLIRVEYYDKKTDKTYMYTLDNYDFGKTVFLTKEEAEKALLKRLECAE